MNKKTLFLVSLLCLVVCGFVMAQDALAATTKKPVGTLVYTTGGVQMKRFETKDFVAVKTGDMVFFGDVLKTLNDGVASLVYTDGSRSSLGPDTQLDIPAIEKGKKAPKAIQVLNLLIGKMWMKVSKREQAFEVRTSSAVAAIKGTKFQMEVDKDGNVVLTVFDGLVEFKNSLGKQLLEASMQALAKANEPPSKPKDVDLNTIDTPKTPDTTIIQDPKTKRVTVQVKDGNGQVKTIILEYEKQ